MKLLCFLFVLFLSVSLPAYSQTPFKKQISVGCMKVEQLNELIKRENWTLKETYLDDYSFYLVQLYENLNKATDKYAIIQITADGVGCLLLLGNSKIIADDKKNRI